MKVNKLDGVFEIVTHPKLHTAMGITKAIKFTMTLGNSTKLVFWFTNKGWLQERGRSWFCPARFYRHEAQRFIDNLSEEINVYAD